MMFQEVGLTLCDHTLQPDDVGMVELAHDRRLPQEVPPLLLAVACLQGLDGYRDLPLPWQPKGATAHLAKLS